MQGTVWYLEDDGCIAAYVKEFLEGAGFRVRVFSDGLESRNALAKETPDVLLIDWNLPDDVGPSICRWVRLRDAALPIMMVTVRDDPNDVVEGLRSGADDYVVKPFVTEVLLSRIEALLRRTSPNATSFTCGGLSLDDDTRAVTLCGEPLELTPLEYRLLALFMKNKGCIVSRDAIRDNIWHLDGSQVSDNALTVAIKRLRAKLGTENHLKTVRSFGYRLEEPR